MEKLSYISPKAEIRASSMQGKGLFASERINEGEMVVRFGGEYTDVDGAEAAKHQGKLVMQWDINLFSLEERGDDDAYFVNHSCDSNVWMSDAFTLIAKRDIEKDEEITADYALWEADEDFVSAWTCHCGTSTCRNKVTGKDWRSSLVQKQYLHHFSPLLNKRIENQLS